MEANRPYVKASALVGLSALTRVVFRALMALTRRDIKAFETRDGSFVSFPYERHSSVGVNVHVLHALARVPGYPNAAAAIDSIVEQ